MSNELLAVVIFKIITVLIGLISIYLGYKLFLKGFDRAAGELSGETRYIKFTLSKAAPGTFFSITGAFIICFNIVQGISFTREEGGEKVPENKVAASLISFPTSNIDTADSLNNSISKQTYNRLSDTVKFEILFSQVERNFKLLKDVNEQYKILSRQIELYHRKEVVHSRNASTRDFFFDSGFLNVKPRKIHDQ